MSWDIFVQDLPADARTVDEIPKNFKPSPIGERSQIIAKICDIIPEANFSDPSWGIINGDDWSIEVNIGDDEVCNGFAFHVRGGDTAVGIVAEILACLRLRTLDTSSGDFFQPGPAADESFRQWRQYRDRIVGDQ